MSSKNEKEFANACIGCAAHVPRMGVPKEMGVIVDGYDALATGCPELSTIGCTRLPTCGGVVCVIVPVVSSYG